MSLLSLRSNLAAKAFPVVCVAIATAAAGCLQRPPPEAPAAPPPAPVSAPVAAEPAPAPAQPQAAPAEKRMHGLASMFVACLEDVNLRDDQKAAIETIRADLKKDAAQAMEAGRAFAKDLADGVAASRVDRAKIDADVRQFQKAVDAAKPALHDALNRLHKMLDSTQRTKLVETMRAKAEAMREAGGAAMGDMMKKLADELGLTPEQQDKIKPKMQSKMQGKPRPDAAMHDKMKAIGDAFMTDKFDAKALDVGKHNAAMVKMMTTGMSEFAESVVGVLTPEQREKLAAHIRMRANGPE